MNWSDLVVLAIILGFGIVGMKKGFIFSIFKLVSFLISIVASIKFYPVVAKILMKTALYTNLKAVILKNLLLQQQGVSPAIDSEVKKAAADTVINSLHLPGFLKGTLISQIPSPSNLIDVNKIMDLISGELATVVIDIASLLVLYILIRIGLIFIRTVLQSIAKLPVFKQMDKLGGFAFGAVEGLLTVYIVFAVIMMFHASPQFKDVFDSIEASSIANFFYQHNFIVDWMFPKGGTI